MIRVLALALLLSGCAKDAEKVESANGNFVVSRLFEFEGCRVYRFSDAGYYIYYSNCNGRVDWKTTQTTGKTTTTLHHQVPTNRGE